MLSDKGSHILSFHVCETPRIGKSVDLISCQELKGEETRSDCLSHRVLLWDDENVLELDRDGTCRTLRMCEMSLSCTL